MEYDLDHGRAGELTRLVLSALGQLKIPVTPLSFAIWYEFLLNGRETLGEKLDAIASGEQPYTQVYAQRLFEDYVLNPAAGKVEHISNEIRRLLEDVIALVSQVGGDATKYNGVLDKCASTLDETTDISQLRELIGALATETRDMLSCNKRFQQQLAETSLDIVQLRKEMAEMREQVAVDPLTGVANRKAFESLVNRLFSEGANNGQMCLMMVDIDHFKRINDEHGHLVGDKVIKFIASTLKRMVKGKDHVSRYGGDEFALVLEQTPGTGAMTVAENIRKEIERSKIKRMDTGDPVGRITVSIGIGCLCENDTLESLLGRADKALYISKSNGRNRTSALER